MNDAINAAVAATVALSLIIASWVGFGEAGAIVPIVLVYGLYTAISIWGSVSPRELSAVAPVAVVCAAVAQYTVGISALFALGVWCTVIAGTFWVLALTTIVGESRK